MRLFRISPNAELLSKMPSCLSFELLLVRATSKDVQKKKHRCGQVGYAGNHTQSKQAERDREPKHWVDVAAKHSAWQGNKQCMAGKIARTGIVTQATQHGSQGKQTPTRQQDGMQTTRYVSRCRVAIRQAQGRQRITGEHAWQGGSRKSRGGGFAACS